MRREKAQVALDGRPPLREAVGAQVRERSRCQSFVADLTSIVSAAHELPAVVDVEAAAESLKVVDTDIALVLGRHALGIEPSQQRSRLPRNAVRNMRKLKSAHNSLSSTLYMQSLPSLRHKVLPCSITI